MTKCFVQCCPANQPCSWQCYWFLAVTSRSLIINLCLAATTLIWRKQTFLSSYQGISMVCSAYVNFALTFCGEARKKADSFWPKSSWGKVAPAKCLATTRKKAECGATLWLTWLWKSWPFIRYSEAAIYHLWLLISAATAKPPNSLVSIFPILPKKFIFIHSWNTSEWNGIFIWQFKKRRKLLNNSSLLVWQLLTRVPEKPISDTHTLLR